MDGKRLITVPNLSSGIAIIWGLFTIVNGEHIFSFNPDFYDPMTSLVKYPAFWGGIWVAAGLTTLFFNYKGKYIVASWFISAAFLAFAVQYFRGDWTLPAWAIWGFVGVCNFVYGRGKQWQTNRA